MSTITTTDAFTRVFYAGETDLTVIVIQNEINRLKPDVEHNNGEIESCRLQLLPRNSRFLTDELERTFREKLNSVVVLQASLEGRIAELDKEILNAPDEARILTLFELSQTPGIANMPPGLMPLIFSFLDSPNP